MRVLTPLEASSPYILLAAFEKAKAEVLLHHLAEREIYVSSGSACASRKEPRSHVLKAMRVPEKWQEGVLRFSLSAWNTEDEMRRTVQALAEIYPVVRK
jgi:cysteine desulfurase